MKRDWNRKKENKESNQTKQKIMRVIITNVQPTQPNIKGFQPLHICFHPPPRGGYYKACYSGYLVIVLVAWGAFFLL